MPRSSSASILQPCVLLTGFGPFPGVADNISTKLVHAIAPKARCKFPQHRFHAHILPTQWNAAPQRVTALLAGFAPVLALHFGVAKEARGFRIESRGDNACRLADDAAGRPPPDSVLVAGGRAQYDVTLPIAAIVERLEELNLPVAISDDAGSYLCNAVLYHALHALAQSGHACRTGFIHIPAELDGPPLTFDEAVAGSLAIIDLALATDQRDRP